MNKQYVIQSGDSLSKIAAAHGLTAQELAHANGIHRPNLIKVGHTLQIPVHHKPVPIPTAKSAVPANHDWLGMLSLYFVDVLNKPIEALKVAIHIGSELFEHKTDSAGKLPDLPIAKKDTPIKVHVEKRTGGLKKIAEFKATSETTSVRLQSPKLAVKSQTRPHEGPPKKAKPKPKPKKPIPVDPGTITETRSDNGNPVQQVALECPNPENLRLGANFKYRDIVIAAAKRGGFSPQAVAAIMNAEAATMATITKIPKLDKNGQPILKEDGTPVFNIRRENKGEWNPRSASPASSARGMTQFLSESWLDQAFINGSFLNERVVKEEWLTTTEIHLTKRKQTITKQVPAFKFANGQLITGENLAKKLFVNYVKHHPSVEDENLRKLLDLRYEPEYSIHVAVDYGVQNLKNLKANRYKIDSLSEGERAKIVYLCHHLGVEDAKDFINDRMTTARAEYLLKIQVGHVRATQMASVYSNDYLKTHREWLNEFINRKINVFEKMCLSPDANQVEKLIPLTEKIRAN